MKVEEVFTDDGDGLFWALGYEDLVRHMGKILFSQDFGSYSGDSIMILEKDGQYGYLCFGWGSCSGCDALQACRSYTELQELYDSLESSIVWYSSKEELKKFIQTHDWESDYFYGESEGQIDNFLAKVLEWCDNV